jgi:hypothetical protein
MKAGSCVINTTSLAAYGGSAELLDYRRKCRVAGLQFN